MDVYGRYNYSIHGGYKPTNITGGHHPAGRGNRNFFRRWIEAMEFFWRNSGRPTRPGKRLHFANWNFTMLYSWVNQLFRLGHVQVRKT